jgi:hypothetical protein
MKNYFLYTNNPENENNNYNGFQKSMKNNYPSIIKNFSNNSLYYPRMFYRPYTKFFESKYFSISNIRCSSSYKYDIIKVEYNIGIYDDDKKLIYPSDFSLYYNLNVFCFLEIKTIKINIYSMPGIDQNRYYKCVEFFKFDEKPTFGIKFVIKKGIEKLLYKLIAFENDNLNYNNLSLKNDTEFAPDCNIFLAIHTFYKIIFLKINL